MKFEDVYALNKFMKEQSFWTGLLDINGKRICVGDRIRFYPQKHRMDMDEIWDGTVTFEDGVFTIDILDAAQFKNPKNWDREHEWIASRSWGCQVGYGEYGSWNVPRTPLTKIQRGFQKYEDVKVLYEKYGYGNRIINAEIIERKENNHV